MEEVNSSSLSIVRNNLAMQGVSKAAQDIICKSWRLGTSKQYDTYLKRWEQFCCRRKVDTVFAFVTDILDFLVELFNMGLKYSALNTARSALSSTIVLHDSVFSVGQHPLVSRFLKGVFEQRPALPRYNHVWNVETVLNFLEKLSPLVSLTLSQLTIKLVTLLCLLSGQRCQSLHSLNMNDFIWEPEGVTIPITSVIKQSKPNRAQPVLVLPLYSNENLCVVRTLNEYISRTTNLRGNICNLFITTVKPYSIASKSTIARWVKSTLRQAGINTKVFSAHSTRAASTSAASRNISLTALLKVAGWASCRTFQKFYDLSVDTVNDTVAHNADFALSVLSSHKD
ncbi:uncharacterized protein LOC130010303 [Patella vulgata]|uniref:uncharacterized protein LOC130010303 n=1 Tax=Patella vulgata TaxID=6465 RepID=UPI0024A84023|nr:uncharacterized protein LOC130010303 [Patella vulgata]XP_055955527.1 uncharacterized protein LOC130010303 [Patella vulgata]